MADKCIFCHVNDESPTYAPYCSKECAAQAEADDAMDESIVKRFGTFVKEDWDDDDPTGPDEEDITTPDGNEFYYFGRRIASSETELKSWMKTHQWFPNVWFVSDHGNAHLLNLGEAYTPINGYKPKKDDLWDVVEKGTGKVFGSNLDTIAAGDLERKLKGSDGRDVRIVKAGTKPFSGQQWQEDARPWYKKDGIRPEAKKAVTYHTCPECESNFKSTDMKNGKLPEHKFNGERCPGSNQYENS